MADEMTHERAFEVLMGQLDVDMDEDGRVALKGKMVTVFAHWLQFLLELPDRTPGNFVTATIKGADGETYSITFQREGGLTPDQKLAQVEALQARVKELEAEAESRDEQIADMIDASGQICACGYDHASDICLGHYPHFKKSVAEARNQALEDAAKVADSLFYPDETKISARIRDAIRAMKS